MSRLWLLSLIALSLPARAFELSVGVEGAFTSTVAGNPAAQPSGAAPAGGLDGAAGLLLEQRMPLDGIFLELWEDGQTPLVIQTGASVPASYIPLTAGVRAGLIFGRLQPYLGTLFQLDLLTHQPANGQPLDGNTLGVGGDLGLDLIGPARLRFGLEVRAVEVFGGILSQAATSQVQHPSGAFEMQTLAAARFSL